MKIAHVCPFYTPAIGGVKQVVEELSRRQIQAGHEVHVYTSDWDKNKRIGKKEEIIDGVKVHRCFHFLRVANFITIWPAVFFKLLREDFDIIHTHVAGHPHCFFAGLAARIKKEKVVHTTHCPWTDAHRSLAGKIGLWLDYRTFMKLSFKWADRIIAITPWEIQFIKKWCGDVKKIDVVPNGMSGILFKKVRPNNFKKRNEIKGKLVLFFGRLNVTKGPDKFVEAAKEILKERKDIYFVIRGPDEGMRHKVASMMGKEKKIILMKETRDKKEIAEMYQAADVFVLPSYREGLPLTLFEAMAAGLPIIASPVNGVPYEMKDGKNGYFVEYGDINGLKREILRVLDNKLLAAKFRANNIKRAKSYDWDKIAKRTEKVYKEIL